MQPDRTIESKYASEINRYRDLIICCYMKCEIGQKIKIGGSSQLFTVIEEATKQEYIKREGKFRPLWDFFYKVITD